MRNKKDNKKDNFFNKNPLLTFVLFTIIMVAMFKVAFNNDGMGLNTDLKFDTKRQSISYFEFKQLIKNNAVDQVFLSDKMVKAIKFDGKQKMIYSAKRVAPDNNLVSMMDEKEIEYSGYSENNWLSDILFGWVIPILIFFGIWMLITSRMQKNMGGGILGVGSSSRVVNEEKPNVTFKDVAGNKEAKNEVEEITDFLKHPDRYIRLGAKIPTGVLLVGPPGTGKTLLAKAVAGEASVPFFSVSGSGFIEMFVGVGASRVRDLFEQAKKVAPSIIFIDEIDAIGKSRASGGNFGGNDEREQTLNQLLAEMDGFGSSPQPVIVLAATNRPETLDPALLRPGRFDRQVLVDKPDYRGRIEILEVHIKGYELSDNVDLSSIAKLTAGLAGADLANIINEAALLAGREEKKVIDNKYFLEAVERQIAGLEKKSRRISPEEKKIVAYHESGHALIAQMTKGAKKVSKVSIIPRGLAALGYTLNTPEENKYLMQKHELVAEVDVLLGGRAAEDVFLSEISTGAGNDLERATDILKAMASIYGMTDVAGLMVLSKTSQSFLGSQQSRDYSEKMSEDLDDFIKVFLNDRYDSVKKTLRDNKPIIEKMVNELFEKETIDGKFVEQIIEEYKTKDEPKSNDSNA